MAQEISVNIGSDNSLLPKDIQPSPEPKLTYQLIISKAR